MRRAAELFRLSQEAVMIRARKNDEAKIADHQIIFDQMSKQTTTEGQQSPPLLVLRLIPLVLLILGRER